MNTKPEPQTERDRRLATALEEYRSLLERQQRVDRKGFLAGYPDLALELSECLEGLEFVQRATGELAIDRGLRFKDQRFIRLQTETTEILRG